MGNAILLMNNGGSLKSIAITSPPSKTKYSTRSGSTFDTTNMVVTAYYMNGTSKVIETSKYTYSPTRWTTATAAGQTETLTVSYTENGITKEAYFNGITVINSTKKYTFIETTQVSTGTGTTITSKNVDEDYKSFIKAVYEWAIKESPNISQGNETIMSGAGNYTFYEAFNGSKTNNEITNIPFGNLTENLPSYPGRTWSGTFTDNTAHTVTSSIGLALHKTTAQTLHFSIGGSVTLTTAL